VWREGGYDVLNGIAHPALLNGIAREEPPSTLLARITLATNMIECPTILKVAPPVNAARISKRFPCGARLKPGTAAERDPFP